MSAFLISAIAVFGIGLWIGVGAPGWPHNDESGRRHTQKRPLNPIAWGRTPDRDRQRPRGSDDRRRIRLR